MGNIVVVGLGYEIGQLTLEAVELMKSGAKIVLHTGRCGCAEWLKKESIAYETLDALYEATEDFDEHARMAAEAVCAASEEGDVVYGVFDVRDRSVGALLDMTKNVRIVAGPPAEGMLFARAQGAVELLEASDWENYVLSSAKSALIRELDSRELASEVKLKLMEIYPDETAVFVHFGDGGMAHTELYNLDRLKKYDHRTCALVTAEPELVNLERFDFARLQEVISVLLGPDGCPWDREQTHKSLKPYMIEEAYEVAGAIDEEDPYHLYDELGDMLLQVMLHSEIARKHGEFDIGDVITAISEKMISRHSHIFGSDHVDDAGEVTDLWNKNKMAERGQTTYTESMKDVSHAFPALLRAVKLLKRLDNACGVKESVSDALSRAAASVNAIGSAGNDEEAFGRALLDLTAAARTAGVDPELALNAASDRMIDCFASFEEKVSTAGKVMDMLDGKTRKEYWDLVKLWKFAE